MDVDSCVGQLESAPQTRLPRHADGTDRRSVAGSGRPACPTAIPIARSCIRVASQLGSERWMWTVVFGNSSRHPKTACPAMPTALTDGAVSGSGRPACPTAIPIARSCIELSSLYWEVKDGCGQLCQPTRVGTPAQLPGHADGSQSQRSFRAEQPSRRVCTTIA
jgi:hypothetical protein